MKESLKKKLISIFDCNRNKKIDWYEVFLPIPDINRNKKIDWWEAFTGLMIMVIFWGLLIGGAILLNTISK